MISGVISIKKFINKNKNNKNKNNKIETINLNEDDNDINNSTNFSDYNLLNKKTDFDKALHEEKIIRKLKNKNIKAINLIDNDEIISIDLNEDQDCDISIDEDEMIDIYSKQYLNKKYFMPRNLIRNNNNNNSNY